MISTHFKRIFSALTILLLGAAFKTPLSFAVSTATVTGYTSPMVIGTADDMEIEFTVDTSELTWLNDDYLMIDITPSLALNGWSDLDISVEFDEDTINDGVGETAIPENIVQTRGQYLISVARLYIYWDEDAWAADNGDTLRILINDLIPQYDDDNHFEFISYTATEGINPISTETILFEVPDAEASVTLGDNAGVGDVGETTISFTSPLEMDALDSFSLVFPAFVDITEALFQSQTFGGAGDFNCSPTGQSLDCSATGTITKGTGSVILSGITTTSVDTTDITQFYVYNDGPWYMASDASVALTDSREPTSGGGGGAPVHGATTTTSSSSSSSSTTTDGSTTSSSDSDGNIVASPFSDLQEGSRYYDAVLHLYELGIVTGYPDGTVRVSDTINRAELIALLVRGLDVFASSTNCFTDVKNEWFANYVCYAKEEGWVDGYANHSFKPQNSANTAEVIKIVMNSVGVEVSDPASGDSWYTPYVDAAQNLGLIPDDLALAVPATRGFVFKFLSDILNLIPTTL